MPCWHNEEAWFRMHGTDVSGRIAPIPLMEILFPLIKTTSDCLCSTWTNKEWKEVARNNLVVLSPRASRRGGTLNPTYIRKRTAFLRYDVNHTHTTIWYNQSPTSNLIVGAPPTGSPSTARLTYSFVECDWRSRKISQYLKGRGINVISLAQSLCATTNKKLYNHIHQTMAIEDTGEGNGAAQSLIFQMQLLEPTIPLTSLLMSHQAAT